MWLKNDNEWFNHLFVKEPLLYHVFKVCFGGFYFSFLHYTPSFFLPTISLPQYLSLSLDCHSQNLSPYLFTPAISFFSILLPCISLPKNMSLVFNLMILLQVFTSIWVILNSNTVFTRANIDHKCVLLVFQAPVPWIFFKSSLANW